MTDHSQADVSAVRKPVSRFKRSLRRCRVIVRLFRCLVEPLPVWLALIVVGWSLPRSPLLATHAAPRGMLSLQLCETSSEAERIVASWESIAQGIIEAQRNLSDDESFAIPVYVLLLSLATLYVDWRLHAGASRSRLLTITTCCIIAGVLIAASLDLFVENPTLKQMLAHAAKITNHDVAVTRTAAQAKFVLLSMAVAWLLAGSFAVMRRVIVERRTSECRSRSFQELYRRECSVRVARIDGEFLVGDEPWLRRTAEDSVGLALSGGGIRSATFNLGLLQCLDRLHLLPIFDYVSTVSGGGYIGGWWSAWRLRAGDHSEAAEPPLFPPHREPEIEEVRHLREFSNFLAPRWGFFETEMWTSLIAVLFGLGPTLLSALTALALTQLLWAVSTAFLGVDCPWLLWLAAVVPAAAILLVGERIWSWRQKADQSSDSRRRYIIIGVFALLIVVVVASYWELALRALLGDHWEIPFGSRQHELPRTWLGWMEALGTTADRTDWHLALRLFDLPGIWLVSGALFSVIRIVLTSAMSRDHAQNWLPPVDRALQRLLGLGVFIFLASLLWEVGVNLFGTGTTTYATGGAVGSAGLFAWLRQWLPKLQTSRQQSNWLAILKPYVPQVLAYVAVGLMDAVVVSLMVQGLGTHGERWLVAWFVVVVLLALALHMSPSEFGLHKLYRDRITRAFLGASNPLALASHNPVRFSAKQNRQTDVRQGDDVALGELQKTSRPLHLVCCAANHLSGDPLGTLSRGARSAVLSCCGLSIGNDWAERPQVTLATALTASAAAFNSQMGALSMKLGPAVGFLMSALNLRLGVWLSHPRALREEPKWFPGLLFFRELFGMSDCDPDQPATDVHLSDGGHFENLALYELIRRHCRYIVCSDCGADPDVVFEDFGNAVRRIRTDFGVDIEIDLEPLRPGPDGRSRQHVAVGIIRFEPDGDDFDVGVLIYIKPTLTGDEPYDVLNYKSLNTAFPHESTGDQFYDEAQWEAYRRLGSHAVFEAFRFLEGMNWPPRPGDKPVSPSRLFAAARQAWYPTPPDFDRKLMELNARFIDLEQRLANEAPAFFVNELYPELTPISHGRGHIAPATPETNRDERSAVHLLVQMIQLIEDVALSVDLDRNFNHPAMMGWMNTFSRWSRARTFQIWWPFLAPLYTPKTKDFVETHLDLRGPTQAVRPIARFGAAVTDPAVARVLASLGTTAARWQSTTNSHTQWEYGVLELVASLETGDVHIPVGVARYETNPQGVTWNDEDFIVIPGLWNTGLGSQFLIQFITQMLRRLPEQTPRPLRVRINLHRTDETIFTRRSSGHRRERNDMILFYKRQGFRPLHTASTEEVILLR